MSHGIFIRIRSIAAINQEDLNKQLAIFMPIFQARWANYVTSSEIATLF